MTLLTALFAVAFALIHLFAGKMRFLDVVPRSRWLSAAGGVAVAYTFLHILPELSAHQQSLGEGSGGEEQEAENWIYLAALAGLAAFYGLERMVTASRGRSRESGGLDRAEDELCWIHIGSFGIYNVLIGYLLLHREETGLWALVIYSVAMALHFVTNDFGLRQDHMEVYDHKGRWVLAGAILLGWLLGVLITVPEVVIGFLFAFLASGVVLNVLKEELPEERKSHFGASALGCAGYAGLLLLTRSPSRTSDLRGRHLSS